MKSTITALIPAKNEEKNIARCLKSLKWCDEVVVICSGNDKTKEIAEKMGAHVVEKNKTKGDDFVLLQQNINSAIQEAKTDWIFRVDADEEVTVELQKEIEMVLENPTDIVAYRVPRNQYFWGGFLRGGDWAFDRLVRLFKKNKAKYDPIVHVHEQFKVDGAVGFLHQALNHYSHPTLEDAQKKFQSYTDIEVEDLHISLFKAYFNLFFQPPYVFFRWLFWHRGYIDGVRGVVAAGYRAWYEVLLYTKYIQKKKTT